MQAPAGPARRDRARAVAGAVLLLGLLWRALVAFVFVPWWEARSGHPSDPDSYIVLARSLRDEGVLGYDAIGASPTTVRGPAFPAWLAAGSVAGGDGAPFLGWWSGIPGVIAGAIVAGLAARRWGSLAGATAGAIAVAHPLPSILASRVMGDEFTGATALLGLLAFDRALAEEHRSRSSAWGLLAAALLAIHMLSRSSGLLVLAAVGVLAMLRRPRRPALAALVVAAALLPPLAWSVRSSRLEGRPVFVHSLAAYNFWVGEAFDRLGMEGEGGRRWGDAMRIVLHAAGRDGEDADHFWYGDLTPAAAGDLDGRLARAAVDRIARDPIGYAGRFVRGIGRFWFGAGTFAGRTWQYALVALPMLLLAASGAAWSLRRRGDDAAFPSVPLAAAVVTLVFLTNLAYAATLPMARMSVQVYPALAFLASAGVAVLLRLRPL